MPGATARPELHTDHDPSFPPLRDEFHAQELDEQEAPEPEDAPAQS